MAVCMGSRVMKLGFVFVIVVMTFSLGGCQTQSTRPADPPIQVQSWIGPDGNQVILRIPGEEHTHYYDNDEEQICFHFSDKGMWNPIRERGLLVSQDRKDQIGILMMSTEDLENYSDEDLLAEAVASHLEDFQKRFESTPLASQTIEITATPEKNSEMDRQMEGLRDGQELIGMVNRWLIEDNQYRIAAITASDGSGGCEMATQILRSFEASQSPGCFWPRIYPILSSPYYQCEI